MPKQNVVSVFHVIHRSRNNSINPDMNKSVLSDIRLSLGLPKMIAEI